MRLIENMTLLEIENEIRQQERIIVSANSIINKLHGQKNYQDEVAKYFFGGMVGFRKDRKRVNRSINQYTDNAVKACEQYERRDNAISRIESLENAASFIRTGATEDDKFETVTCKIIKDRKKKSVIEATQDLKWEKINGHYGVAYQHGTYVVERCDIGFVAVRDTDGNLLTHCKTVKEAKAFVSIAISKVS